MVLGDDAFATLLFGLREGRRIVANVQKGLVFLVSTHVALLGFILIATIGGYDQPLLPIQILWLELFIDLATSIAFEREPEEPGDGRRPRPRDRPLLTTSLLARIAGAGGFSAVAAFLVLVLHDGPPEQVLAGVHDARGRSGGPSLCEPEPQPTGVSLRPNGFLAAAAIVVIVVQAAIPLVPPLADAFRAVPLGAADWLLIAVVAFAPAALAELIRWRTGPGQGLTESPARRTATRTVATGRSALPGGRAGCHAGHMVTPPRSHRSASDPSSPGTATPLRYGAHSPESLSQRFHGASIGIVDRAAVFFCGPDHEHREGLVAVLDEPVGLPALLADHRGPSLAGALRPR